MSTSYARQRSLIFTYSTSSTLRLVACGNPALERGEVSLNLISLSAGKGLLACVTGENGKTVVLPEDGVCTYAIFAHVKFVKQTSNFKSATTGE